jgi:cobalt-zinc-cadmium efflux system outer membrane protein
MTLNSQMAWGSRGCVLLALPLVSLLAEASLASAGSPDDPSALADIAIEANPALESVKKRISALQHKADAAVRWRDPVFALEYSNVPWDSWTLGDSPMSGVQFTLQQTLTLPGKNDRRAETVHGEAEVTRWELRERATQLRALVKQTYWNLALVRQLELINKRHIELVDQLLAAVRAKYQVGKVGQHDLLSLEVLQKKLADDRGQFEQKERELIAALNAALQRKAQARVATPDSLPVANSMKPLPTLLQLAQKYRPKLLERRATSKWKRLAAQQAGYERWPDLTLWLGYRVRTRSGADPGSDFFNVGLAVPLPLDYTGQAKAEQQHHLALAAAADASYQAVLDELRAALEAALARWTRAVDKAKTYRSSIIPSAEQTLRATLAAYQTDRADFASLYQAEAQLLQYERAAKVAQATTQIERSKVEALVGSELNDPAQSEVTR